jgi:hypothetical protein
MQKAKAVVGLRHEARLLHLASASLLIIFLAGCLAGPPAVVTIPGGTAQGTPSPTSASILDGSLQSTTLDQIEEAIDKLYRDHPDINSFAARSVTYTPATRDKVLKVCSEGGLVAPEQEREAQEILACAPLIFFFYYYGQQTSVPESVDVARRLYWYAMADKSQAARKVLTDALRSWGIN